MRLDPRIPIDPAETLFSWLSRLAATHAGFDLVPFLNDLQIRPRDIEIGANGAHERLARFTGVSVEQMAPQHYFALPDRRLRFRDKTFAVEFAPRVHRMICPLCLEEDGGVDAASGSRRWRFRFLWQVRYCPVCPKHGVSLVSPVHDEMGFVPPHDTARAIGGRLPALIKKAATRRITQLQPWVEERMQGRRGDGWLDAQDIDQATKAAEMLGVVVAHGPMPNMNLFGPADWDEAWQAGYEVASKGEIAILTELDRLTARGRLRPCAQAQASLGRLYQWLAFNKASGLRAGPIRKIVREHILDNYPYSPGELLLGEVVTSRRVHNAQSLSRAAGLHHKTMGNLFIDMGCGNGVTEAGAAERFAADFISSVPLSRVPAYLNCSRVHARLLLEGGIIKPLGASGKCDLHTRFRPSDLDGFLQRLVSRATRPQPADDATDFANCAMKAKVQSTRIVRAVLEGRLSEVGLAPGVRGYLGIRVSVEEAKRKLRD